MRIVGGADVLPSKRPRIERAASTERPAAEERAVLKFAKLSEHAAAPTRGSAKAAGYDLYRLVARYTFYFLSSHVHVEIEIESLYCIMRFGHRFWLHDFSTIKKCSVVLI